MGEIIDFIGIYTARRIVQRIINLQESLPYAP